MSQADRYQVDIPAVVDPETAADIRDDLKSDGRVEIVIDTSNSPNVVAQIEWQLAHERPLLEFCDAYRVEGDGE
jgi:hypothetical protein